MRHVAFRADAKNFTRAKQELTRNGVVYDVTTVEPPSGPSR